MLIREIITEVSRVKMGTDDQGYSGAWVSDTGLPEKTVQLPVNRIRVHEPDTKFDDPGFGKNLANIKSALRRGEKLPPILVRRMPGEFLQYQVIDGHHRFKAYRDLGLKKIPARIVHKFNITDLVSDHEHQ